MNCHRNSWDQVFYNNLPNISNSVKFAVHLFQQLYWRQILASMYPTVFGERYQDAYDNQKNYLTDEICKPFGMSVDKAFRRLDLLCKTLEYFPPPFDRDSTVSTEDWDGFECTKEAPTRAVHQYKFSELLPPEHFQDHIQSLENDWLKMSDTKFLNIVKEFKSADKKKRADDEKKKSALQKKREESKADDGSDDGNCAQKSKRHSHKKARRKGSKNHKDYSEIQRFCYLCNTVGAPAEFVYGNHNTNQYRKKAECERNQTIAIGQIHNLWGVNNPSNSPFGKPQGELLGK